MENVYVLIFLVLEMIENLCLYNCLIWLKGEVCKISSQNPEKMDTSCFGRWQVFTYVIELSCTQRYGIKLCVPSCMIDRSVSYSQ